MRITKDMIDLSHALKEGQGCLQAWHDAVVEGGFPNTAYVHAISKHYSCMSYALYRAQYCWAINIIINNNLKLLIEGEESYIKEKAMEKP